MDYIPADKRISPNCCEKAKVGAVLLQFGFDDIYKSREGQEDRKPRWVVLGMNDERWYPAFHDASFCPFCGQKLPEIKRREKPISPICKVTDGGYYCDTCGERLHACKCYPCEFAWEIDETNSEAKQ